MADKKHVRLFASKVDAFASIVKQGLMEGAAKAKERHAISHRYVEEAIQRMQLAEKDSAEYHVLKDRAHKLIATQERMEIAAVVWSEVLCVYASAESEYVHRYNEDKKENAS